MYWKEVGLTIDEVLQIRPSLHFECLQFPLLALPPHRSLGCSSQEIPTLSVCNAFFIGETIMILACWVMRPTYSAVLSLHSLETTTAFYVSQADLAGESTIKDALFVRQSIARAFSHAAMKNFAVWFISTPENKRWNSWSFLAEWFVFLLAFLSSL